MKSIKETYKRNIEIQKLSSRPVGPKITLDKVLDLKYTPYIKFVYHTDEKKYFFIVSFLSDKGSKITDITSTVINSKLHFNIIVDTSSIIKSVDIFSQVMIDLDDEGIDINFRNDIKNKKNINYLINIKYDNTFASISKLPLGGSNSTGGTTDPFEEVPFV